MTLWYNGFGRHHNATKRDVFAAQFNENRRILYDFIGYLRSFRNGFLYMIGDPWAQMGPRGVAEKSIIETSVIRDVLVMAKP